MVCKCATLGCKDKGIRKSELVAKTHFFYLWNCLVFSSPRKFEICFKMNLSDFQDLFIKNKI